MVFARTARASAPLGAGDFFGFFLYMSVSNSHFVSPSREPLDSDSEGEDISEVLDTVIDSQKEFKQCLISILDRITRLESALLTVDATHENAGGRTHGKLACLPCGADLGTRAGTPEP